MAHDPVRRPLALALSVAALVHAGCIRAAYSPREAPGYAPPADGDVLGAGPAEPLDMSRGVHGTLGAEVGELTLRGDGFCDEFEKAVYYGARYSRMLGFNWGLSITAGYVSVPAEDVGEDDLDFYLTRCSLEFGTYIGPSLCRWYIGAGGGYTIFDEEEDLSALGLGTIDNEWTTHAVVGVEFRNETIFATRIEGSHAWLEDSGADHWLGTATIAVQF